MPAGVVPTEPISVKISSKVLKQRIRQAAESIMLVAHEGTTTEQVERIITDALAGKKMAPLPRKDENIMGGGQGGFQ